MDKSSGSIVNEMLRHPDELRRAYAILTARDAPFPVTDRQAALLRFIGDFHAVHGVSPTFEQMAAGIGVANKSGVHRLIEGLERRGAITRIPRARQSIRINEPGRAF